MGNIKEQNGLECLGIVGQLFIRCGGKGKEFFGTVGCGGVRNGNDMLVSQL